MDEFIKLNIKTPVNGNVNLNVTELTEKNGELNIRLGDKMCYNINEGDIIYFSRFIRAKDELLTFSDFVVVKEEDSEHVLHTTLPEKKKIRLEKNFFEFKYNQEEAYYIITCAENHYLFGQDLYTTNKQTVTFKKNDGTILGVCSDIKPLHLFRMDELTKEDCIEYSDFDPTCGKNYDNIETRHYNFFPECAGKRRFIAKDFNVIEMSSADYIETEFNAFYYYTIKLGVNEDEDEEEHDEGGGSSDSKSGTNGVEEMVPVEFDDYGKPIKHCFLYGDLWFDSFHDSTIIKYVNDSPNNNNITFDMNYYSATVGLFSDSNEVSLGCEDYFTEDFTKQLEDSMVPDIIDMERVKYVPWGNGTFLTSIAIHPHFRERVILDEENNTNTVSTSGNLYYDGWYIDTDNEYDVYWNGYKGDGSLESIKEFIEQSGKTSDLIGFLNFTDNDIYYKKNKVGKSFFRLLYYDSPDPIEQKLLYYSTVFIDSTELFSKYLKQSEFMREEPYNIIMNEINVIEDYDYKNYNVNTVFCENNDVGSRLDTTILLTNEYDRERSSEGFNIYLFSDDAPEVKEEKTIYMKVEFNHAGNGKTIPMIVMPTTEKLTMENFLRYLYIPIKIEKKYGKYTYMIQDAKYDENDMTKAYLEIFEPKLDMN